MLELYGSVGKSLPAQPNGLWLKRKTRSAGLWIRILPAQFLAIILFATEARAETLLLELRPEPGVVVRIFRLSADAAFRSAGIVNLQGDEPALVAGDLTGPVLSQLLRPGQTVLLSGLMQNQYTETVNKVPVLGALPLIGSLFRSTLAELSETELLIIVTADVLD